MNPKYALAIPNMISGTNPQVQVPLEAEAYTATPWGNTPNTNGYVRAITPEFLLGDGCLDFKHMMCDKARRLAPWSSNAPLLTRQLDYNSVGVIGQGRAVAELLYSGYPNQGTRYAMTVAGTSATHTFNSDADNANTVAESLGIVIDFGVNMLNFAPFDLQIATTGFINLGVKQATNANLIVSVDRNITVRVNTPNGGSIYVPWAHRVTAPVGTMQDALIQVGRAQPRAGEVPADVSTVSILGIPSALVLANAFQATMQFMTAGAPVTATWAELVGLMRGTEESRAAIAALDI